MQQSLDDCDGFLCCDFLTVKQKHTILLHTILHKGITIASDARKKSSTAAGGAQKSLSTTRDVVVALNNASCRKLKLVYLCNSLLLWFQVT